MADFDARAFMTSVLREAGEHRPPQWTLRGVLGLLRLCGQDFLDAAYRMLLGRQPDVLGARGYLPRTTTLAGRIRILLALTFSAEQTWVPAWLRRCLACLRSRKN